MTSWQILFQLGDLLVCDPCTRCLLTISSPISEASQLAFPPLNWIISSTAFLLGVVMVAQLIEWSERSTISQ